LELETKRMQHHTLLARSAAAVIALALASAAAADEPNPYYIGASQALSYQMNVYSSQFNPVNSGISTTSLLGGVDQHIGRQRVFANGNVGYNYYTDSAARILNNTSYGLNAGLDWETIERLSGTVRLTANQSLANYGTASAPTVQQQNIQNLEQAVLTAKYGITPQWAIEGGYAFHKADYSAPSYAYEEFTQNGVSLGVRYGQGSALSLGVAYRANRAEFPHYLVNTDPATSGSEPYIADHSNGRYVDFTAVWIPNGLSTLDVRLSLSNISYDINQAADFNGLTGELGWNYQVSGKLSSRLSFLVAPGTSATFFGLSSSGPISVQNSTLSKILQYSATYSMTAKTTLTGSLGLIQNRYGQTTPSGTMYGTDLTPSVGLGFTYAPTRNSLLGCNASYLSRSASQQAEALGQSYPYSGTMFTCTGQILLQ
jgi:hypothetical protein